MADNDGVRDPALYVTPTPEKEGDREKKAKMQDASGLGSKVKGTSFKPPAMKPGEDAGAYAARVASARREFEAAAVAGQLKAVKALPKE